MATGKALNGTPSAGNPHVWFEAKEEVASATTLRRGSLLYKLYRIAVGRCGLCALGAVVLLVASADADVVGWWRFNGEGANVPNVANPGTLDGTIVSVSNDNTSAIADVDAISFGSVASKCPTITSRLQGDAPRVYDPLDGQVYGGGKTLSYEKAFVQGGVMVPYSDSLKLTTFTVQAIIRLPVGANSRNTGEGSGMFPIVQFGKDQTEGWMLAVYNGYLFSRFTYRNTSDNMAAQQQITQNYYSDSGFPSLFDGKWHHVAMVFTTAGNNAVCRMFVDGVQYAENRTQTWKSWNYSGNLPLFIGANPWQYARTFYGDIAEVRITNDATSKDQNNNFLVPLLDGQGVADADTALLLTFDNAAKFGFANNATIATKDSPSQSDTHSIKAYVWYAKNWNILNAAYNKPTIPHWLAFATKGAAAHLNPDLWPTSSSDAKAGLVSYASSGATNAMGDTGSLAIPTWQNYTNGNTRSISNLIQLDDGACYLSTNSFTAECFFKTSIADGVTDTIFYSPFIKLCVHQGKLLFRGYRTGNEDIIGDIKGSVSVNDGEWHHVACVYDAATTKYTLWQDGQSVGSKSGTALYSGGYQTKSGLTTLGFLIGGQRYAVDGDVQGFMGNLDMVRITRRALGSDEFLTSIALPERLLDARFDGDTSSSFATGLPDYLAPAGTGATMSGGESAPEIVRSRGGKVVFSDSTKAGSGDAVKLDGGYVIYPRNRLLERRSFTLEFFGKFADLPNAATFARLNIGDGLGTPVWAIYNNIASDNKRRIYAVATVTTDGGVTFDRGSDLPLYNLTDHADEVVGWHHWALTVEQQASRVEVKLYKDGENVTAGGQTRKNGQLYLPPEGTSLSFGASTASSAYMKGVFDNIRISDGVLDPSEFMVFESAGTMLLVR